MMDVEYIDRKEMGIINLLKERERKIPFVTNIFRREGK